ncbi:MAG: hypothetical protein ACFB21_13680 [Opitutales bacterium]
MSVLELTVEKLKGLPEDKIEAVARYIDELGAPTVGRFDDLAGAMSHEDIAAMREAIDSNCEQVDKL